MKASLSLSLVWNISCEFASDLCQWSVESTDTEGNFIWKIKTAEELAQEGAAGPPEDHWNSVTGHFMIVSADYDLQAEPYRTRLVSPYLVGQDHPIECLKFWFSRAVSFHRLSHSSGQSYKQL